MKRIVLSGGPCSGKTSALETVGEPWNLGESTVAYGPVGQHALEGGEKVE